MRRELYLGLAAVVVVVGVGIFAVLWLIRTVNDKDDGRIHRAGQVQAVYVAADDRTLTAEASLPFCGDATLDVDESGSTITLGADVAIDPSVVCPMVIGAKELTARLDDPVGDRTIVSGSGAVDRIDAADLPRIDPVPAGFRAGADKLGPAGAALVVDTQYTSSGAPPVAVQRGPTQFPIASGAKRTEVRGRPAWLSTPSADAAILTWRIGRVWVQVTTTGPNSASTVRAFGAATHK